MMDDISLNSDQIQSQRDIQKYKTRIVILGSGGAGNNTINRLTDLKLDEIYTIAANTDAHDLLSVAADRRILIGNNITGGLGAGGDPMIGEQSALESRDTLRSVLQGADILFLTGGLGGGTGTGSLPVIGHLTREMGILTVAMVTMPFSDEGIIRWENAQIGLEKLRKKVDTIIVLRNDKLVELYEDLPLNKAFAAGDEVIINALTGLSSLISKNGLINLDFADISTVLRDGPDAVIGVGESNSENRAEEAFKRATIHPMMEMEIDRAQSAIVQVSGGTDLSLKEARKVVFLLSKKLDPHARIIWGVNVEKSLRQTMRVMIVASGLFQKITLKRIAQPSESEEIPTIRSQQKSGESTVVLTENGTNIFDIKDSILATGSETIISPVKKKSTVKTSPIFYKIMNEEAQGDLKRFDRAIHYLRQDNENRKALLDAKQSCKLLYASSKMFGFDEIGLLLQAIEDILSSVQSREIKLTDKILDSLSLAMEMVVDLIENHSDGRGETGYIVDRLRQVKEETSTS